MRARSFTDVEKSNIGLRIRNIRISHGLTMQELGATLIPGTTIAQSVVSRWERGLSVPNSKRLAAISKLGNITMDELLTGGQVSQPDTNDPEKPVPPVKETEPEIVEEAEVPIQVAIGNADGTPFSDEQQLLMDALYRFFETYQADETIVGLAGFIDTLNMASLPEVYDSELYKKLYENAASQLYNDLKK